MCLGGYHRENSRFVGAPCPQRPRQCVSRRARGCVGETSHRREPETSGGVVADQRRGSGMAGSSSSGPGLLSGVDQGIREEEPTPLGSEDRP